MGSCFSSSCWIWDLLKIWNLAHNIWSIPGRHPKCCKQKHLLSMYGTRQNAQKLMFRSSLWILECVGARMFKSSGKVLNKVLDKGCNTSYPSPKNESHQNTLPGRPTDQTKKVIGWGDFAVFVRICWSSKGPSLTGDFSQWLPDMAPNVAELKVSFSDCLERFTIFVPPPSWYICLRLVPLPRMPVTNIFSKGFPSEGNVGELSARNALCKALPLLLGGGTPQQMSISISGCFVATDFCCIVTSKILVVGIPLSGLAKCSFPMLFCHWELSKDLKQGQLKCMAQVARLPPLTFQCSPPTFQCCSRTNKREWFGMMVIKNPSLADTLGGAVNHQLLLKQKWEGFSQKKTFKLGIIMHPRSITACLGEWALKMPGSEVCIL